MKLMIVLGEGGHTKEMLSLVDLLGTGYEYSYLLVMGDELSEEKIVAPAKLHYAQRPRDKAHNLILDVLHAPKIDGARPANHADDLVTQGQQVFRKVGAVLTGDPGYQCLLCHLHFPNT